jgi:hypothetical protein
MTTTQNTCHECLAPIPSPTHVWERFATEFMFCTPCIHDMDVAEELEALDRANSWRTGCMGGTEEFAI